MHNLHHSKLRFAQPKKTAQDIFVFKNQLKKMQARGKTCFLQHTQVLLKQKSEKVHQKKATEKMDVLKNELKKCKLEVRRVFVTKQDIASGLK